MTKPGNSNTGRSKDGSQSTRRRTLLISGGDSGAQVIESSVCIEQLLDIDKLLFRSLLAGLSIDPRVPGICRQRLLCCPRVFRLLAGRKKDTAMRASRYY